WGRGTGLRCPQPQRPLVRLGGIVGTARRRQAESVQRPKFTKRTPPSVRGTSAKRWRLAYDGIARSIRSDANARRQDARSRPSNNGGTNPPDAGRVGEDRKGGTSLRANGGNIREIGGVGCGRDVTGP